MEPTAIGRTPPSFLVRATSLAPKNRGQRGIGVLSLRTCEIKANKDERKGVVTPEEPVGREWIAKGTCTISGAAYMGTAVC